MLRVMLVDESQERAKLLRESLVASGYEVVGELADTLRLHQEVCRINPDVIIIDKDSPDRDTLENLCVVSRDQPRPIVLFTADSNQEKIREAVRAGVTAYIVGGLSAERVRPIVDVAVARFEAYQGLQAQLAETQARLADRKVIEQAKGILMKIRQIPEETAYQLLRREAMASNRRIGDLARQIISTAKLLA